MAVSIVSNPFGDDTNTPTSIFPPKSDTISPIVGQNNTADNTISVVDETIQAITDPAHQVQDTSTVSNDEQRLNDLHPEETIAPVVDEEKQTEPTSASIPNMYIQADRDSARMVADEAADEAVDVAIFSPEKEQADVG